MSEKENTVAREKLAKKIIKKAREDQDFKKVLLENPSEALGPFGVEIPDSLVSRYFFYKWYYESILNELKDATPEAGGQCGSGQPEDMDWDFEITKYVTK